MQTAVETLKNHSVNQLQEADMWEVLHCPRLVLEGRVGPRGRRGASHPPGADSSSAWQQSATVPDHILGQPCSHYEGRTANTLGSGYSKEISWVGRGHVSFSLRMFNPSSAGAGRSWHFSLIVWHWMKSKCWRETGKSSWNVSQGVSGKSSVSVQVEALKTVQVRALKAVELSFKEWEMKAAEMSPETTLIQETLPLQQSCGIFCNVT